MSFLSLVGMTSIAPMPLAISSTMARSLSMISSVSPSTSTMHSAPQSGRGLPRALLTALMLTLSMSSQDEGIRGFAMMAEMHFPASSTVLKQQRQLAAFLGLVVSFSVTSVMIPRVPSEPHIRRASWYPEESLMVLVPQRTISPSALTKVSPMTKSLVAPYLTARIPEALLATMPPIWHASADPGDGGKKKPYLASSSLRSL